MERVNISELKANLSKILDKVKAGISMVIIDRNTPVAILSAAQNVLTGKEEEVLLAQLQRSGLIELGQKFRPKERKMPKAVRPLKSISVFQALIDERNRDL